MPEHNYLNWVRAKSAEFTKGFPYPEKMEIWLNSRQKIRDALARSMGLAYHTKVALEPKNHGVLERDGYRIEKLTFQTFPGIRMTANAYVPTEISGRVPAVLCVHGHWKGAKQDEHVQARCLGLVKLGFFVLSVDAFGAGERGLNKALGEYHGEMVGATLFPAGIPLSGIQVVENSRAVDYLTTREEVNGDRIGITGASGGGNQSMYAGAMDERFRCVVPVCSVGTYESYLGAACCMCEVVPGAHSYTEEWGVLGLVAPRGLMVINATRDAIQFSVEKARQSLEVVGKIFELYEVPDHVRHVIVDSGHDYNQPMRESMYGWMTLFLKGQGEGLPIPDPVYQLEDPEDLRCYPGESRPAEWKTLPQYAKQQAQALLAERPIPDSLDRWHPIANQMRRRLPQILVNSKMKVEAADDGGFSFEVEAGIKLKAQRAGKSKSGTVVLVHLEGAEAARTHPLAQKILDEEFEIVTLDLRATGQEAYAQDKIARAPDHNTAEWGLWLGMPLIKQWATDLAALVQAMSMTTPPGELSIVGIDAAGLLAIYVAACDVRFKKAASFRGLGSLVTDVPYEKLRLGLLIPNILREIGDVEHWAALIAPRPLVIAQPLQGTGEPASIGDSFRFTRSVYGLMGQAKSFFGVDSEEDLVRALLA